MKNLFLALALLLIATNSALAQSEETPSAQFKAEIINSSPDHKEADIQIIKVSANNFQLVQQDFIHVNFASSSPAQTLQAEDIIQGEIFYFQAQVNEQAVDWYLVKDYQLSRRPLIKKHSRKIISCGAAILSVLALVVAEKIIQDSKAKLP